MNNKLEAEIKNAVRTVADFPKQGIQFKDISGLFQNNQLSHKLIDEFVKQAKNKVDVVCGIESRGFIFGFPIALALKVPFVLVRKKGKLPPPTESISYDLEYGSAELELVQNQIKPGQKVLIHDDLLATGGTAKACAQLVTKMGGKVEQFSFLIELSKLNGREQLNQNKIVSLATY